MYPLDKTLKDGRPFWSLPKRPPSPIHYDENIETHRKFIAACACLIATTNKIVIPYDEPRSTETIQEIGVKASMFEERKFVPNEEKSKQMEKEVEKEK